MLPDVLMSASPPQVTVTKSPEFRIVYVNGVMGAMSPAGAQMSLYLDRAEPDFDDTGNVTGGTINREMQIEIHMSPATFKAVAEWMTEHVEQFEKIQKQLIQSGPVGELSKPLYG